MSRKPLTGRKFWTKLIVVSCSTVGVAYAADQAVARPAQYVSRVQLAVNELSPELLKRSQALVREEFLNSMSATADLKRTNQEIRTMGNEVVLSVVTDEDVRVPLQAAVASMIEHLNGRVHARGKSYFYRTSLAPAYGGFLEVVADETQTKIRSIAAQGVPLRDLLKEVRHQMGTLSYLIPGECAERLVDFSFGIDDGAPAKSVEVLMGDLATLFGLRQEKRNGTYIFTGRCVDDTASMASMKRFAPSPVARERMRAGFVSVNAGMGAQPVIPQVFFPMTTLE